MTYYTPNEANSILEKISKDLSKIREVFTAEAEEDEIIYQIKEIEEKFAATRASLEEILTTIPSSLLNIAFDNIETAAHSISNGYKIYRDEDYHENYLIKILHDALGVMDEQLEKLNRFQNRTLKSENIVDVNKGAFAFFGDFEKLNKDISDIKKKSQEDAKQIENLKQNVQEEINALNTKYKEDLAKFENISQALTFQTAAETYQSTANKWRNTIVGLAIGLLALLWLFTCWTWIDFEQILKKLGNANINATTSRINTLFYFEIISKSLLRVLILSLVVFLIKFCVKNFNAAKHNAVINLHKANSLATASRLIATSPDTEAFNTIITLAVKEIFSQPKTGFLVKDDSKIDIGLLNDTISTLKK